MWRRQIVTPTHQGGGARVQINDKALVMKLDDFFAAAVDLAWGLPLVLLLVGAGLLLPALALAGLAGRRTS